MIRHIVLLRFPTDLPETQAEGLLDAIEHLNEHIEGIVGFHRGGNVSVEPHVMHGFRHGFWFDFVDEKARDAYLVHPEHQKVGAQLVAAAEGGIDGILVFDVAV